MDVKASSFDAQSILTEVKSLKREEVSDKYIRHIVVDGVVDKKIYPKDLLWNLGVRLNINRDHYKIPTGFYQFGSPTDQSPVIVTGNYKLTFDYLRKYLNKDYWVLVIDTDGINVWCAAGKGRFGTAEVIRMLNETSWPAKHRNIILPQLAAPGIQSHIINQVSRKRVIFGPVRIEDMDDFIENGIKPEMRQVSFDLKDRLLLTPIEFVFSLKFLLLAFLISLLPFMTIQFVWIILTASVIGNILVPALLPLLPPKMFYRKGLLLSFLLFVYYDSTLLSIAMIMTGMLYTAYTAMTFTGSTTFTSLSGVKKEMDKAVPQMITWGLITVLCYILAIVLEVL